MTLIQSPMRLWSSLLATCLLCLVLAPSVRAQGSAPTCGQSLPPSRLLLYSVEPEIVEMVVPAGELTARQKDTLGHAGAHFHLAENAVQGWLGIEHRVLPSPSDPRVFCDAPHSVSIMIGYTNLHILVDSVGAADDCVVAALRAHADKHLRLEERDLEVFLQEEHATIAEGLRMLKATPATSEASATARFETAAHALLTELENRLLLRKNTLRRSVDTQEELTRFAAECGGRARFTGQRTENGI